VGVILYYKTILLEPNLHAYAVTSFNLIANHSIIKLDYTSAIDSKMEEPLESLLPAAAIGSLASSHDMTGGGMLQQANSGQQMMNGTGLDYHQSNGSYMPVIYHHQNAMLNGPMYHQSGGLDMSHHNNNNNHHHHHHDYANANSTINHAHHQQQQQQLSMQSSSSQLKPSGKQTKKGGAQKGGATSAKKRGLSDVANELSASKRSNHISSITNSAAANNAATTMISYNNEEIPMVMTAAAAAAATAASSSSLTLSTAQASPKEVKKPKREPTSPSAVNNQTGDIYQPTCVTAVDAPQQSPALKSTTPGEMVTFSSTSNTTGSGNSELSTNQNMITLQTLNHVSSSSGTATGNGGGVKTIPKIPTVNPHASKYIITKITTTNRLSSPLIGNGTSGNLSQLKTPDSANEVAHNNNNTVAPTITSTTTTSSTPVMAGTQLVKLVSYSRDPMLTSSSLGSPSTLTSASSSSPPPTTSSLSSNNSNPQLQQLNSSTNSTQNSASSSATSSTSLTTSTSASSPTASSQPAVTGGLNEHMHMACLVNGGSHYN
jgi:hypothetical protein